MMNNVVLYLCLLITTFLSLITHSSYKYLLNRKTISIGIIIYIITLIISISYEAYAYFFFACMIIFLLYFYFHIDIYDVGLILLILMITQLYMNQYYILLLYLIIDFILIIINYFHTYLSMKIIKVSILLLLVIIYIMKMNDIELTGTIPFILLIISIGMLYFKQKEIEEEKKIEIKKSIFYKNQSETIMHTYQSLRKFRHDYQSFLISLDYYLKKKDYLSIEKLIHTSMLLPETNIYYTNNDVINAITGYFSELCKNHSISFTFDFNFTHNIDIKEEHLLIIYYNALLNAYEAAIQSNNPSIHIDIKEKYGALEINITNSYLYKPDFKTHKKDKENHGIGMNNIKSNLSYYKYDYEYQVNDKEVQLLIMIYEVLK